MIDAVLLTVTVEPVPPVPPKPPIVTDAAMPEAAPSSLLSGWLLELPEMAELTLLASCPAPAPATEVTPP